MLGIAMGIQNAVVRGVGVRDLTTTVLTLTLTGLAADSVFGGGASTGFSRRIASVVSMFGGAEGPLHTSISWLPADGSRSAASPRKRRIRDSHRSRIVT